MTKKRMTPERTAQHLLSKLWNGTLPVPVFEFVTALGIELRSGLLEDDLSAFLVRDKESTIIGINSIHPKTRQRFSIAHELGHYLLHPSKSFIDQGYGVFFRDAAASTGESKLEIQANRFAAELLMPANALEQELEGDPIDLEDEDRLRMLAAKFAVSPQALTYRLMNLDVVREE